jgi:hypothetical protein
MWPFRPRYPQARTLTEAAQLDNISREIDRIWSAIGGRQSKDMYLPESGGTVPIEHVVKALAKMQNLAMPVGPTEENS